MSVFMYLSIFIIHGKVFAPMTKKKNEGYLFFINKMQVL